MISKSHKLKFFHFIDFICFLFHVAVIVLAIWVIVDYRDNGYNFQMVLACFLLTISYLRAADLIFFWAFIYWGKACFFNTRGASITYHVTKWVTHVAFVWGLVVNIIYHNIYYVTDAWEKKTADWLVFLAIAIYWVAYELLWWKHFDFKIVLKWINKVENPEVGVAAATWNLQRGNSLAKEPSFDKQFDTIKRKKLDVVMFQDTDYLDFFPLISDGFCITPDSDTSRHSVTLAKGDILENKKLQFKHQLGNEDKCVHSSFIKLFNGKYIWATNVWLAKDKCFRVQSHQVLELIDHIDEFCDESANIVIGGTFNLDPHMHAMRYLSYIVCDAWFWSALEIFGYTGYCGEHVFPVIPYYLRSDYLFGQGENALLLHSCTGGEDLSSHRFVSASFEIVSSNAIDTEGAKSHIPLNTTENNQESSIA